MKIYYESQNDWDSEDYYYLHRVLHRMLYYYDKNIEEIKSLDDTKMSDETIVLINCIIRYYHNDFLFEKMDNGSAFKNIKPLEHTLVLDEHPLSEDNVYKEMNVMY